MYPGFESWESHDFLYIFFLFYFFMFFFLSLLLQCKFANSTLLSLLRFSYFITPYDAQASSAFSALITGRGKLKLWKYAKQSKIMKSKVKVKVSHSLIAVGAVGVRVPLYLGHSWWKAEHIPFLSLPYPSLIRKRYPLSAGLTERVFQSPHGAAESRTHAIRRLSAP